MKVFVINLDKDKDRMASVDAQLRRLGIEYERISGVYAKEMPQLEKRHVVNRFRWWCAMGWSVAPGEIGCALSHYNIYRRMVSDKCLPSCCVLEDDVALSPRFKSTLQEIEQWLDVNKPQVVILNDHENKRGNLPAGIYCSSGGLCTDGYVLTRIAAQNLMAANYPIIVPCDRWVRWVQHKRIELYHAAPAVVRQIQNMFGSTTVEKRVAVSQLSFPRRLFHKLKRLVGKTLDFCLLKITGR